jgi:hypothetical protein
VRVAALPAPLTPWGLGRGLWTQSVGSLFIAISGVQFSVLLHDWDKRQIASPCFCAGYFYLDVLGGRPYILGYEKYSHLSIFIADTLLD